MQPIGAHYYEVKYFGCFGFRGEPGFLNCDDICMCVVNKQFEILEVCFIPFMLTCSMMRFLSLLLLGLCACSPVVVLGLSVTVLVVLYVVSAVVAVTVMHVLLFVLHVCVCVCCENVRVRG